MQCMKGDSRSHVIERLHHTSSVAWEEAKRAVVAGNDTVDCKLSRFFYVCKLLAMSRTMR